MSSSTLCFCISILVLSVLLLMLFLPCLSLGFLGDDFLDLEHDFGLRSFARFEAGGFRPLMVAVWALDSNLYGPQSSWGWHLTNILLHTINLFLMILLLKQLDFGKWTILAGAAFFALSYSVVPSVCRVSGRTTVAALVPLLGAMNLHLVWKRKGKRLYLLTALLMVLISLLVKETTLASPLAFASISVFILQRERGRERERERERAA